MNKSEEKLTGVKLYMIMVGMLIAGTLNTLLTKWQNNEIGVKEYVLFGREKGKEY
jgi:hypothetical protein